ncbi:MAG: cytochrome c [Proteobacteria bacterium]|nr:cytochrome c [Pseudomonadota bacterium]
MSRNSHRLLIGVALILVIFGALAFIPSDNSTTTVDFSVDDSLVERGKYLALAGNCASCHTARDGAFMAGGLAFETPFGTIYSTNITPDQETGIGKWTGAEFLNSMRQGVRPDGEHLYPVFPYTAFTKIVDEDMVALFAYLNSIPAVRRAADENEVSFPFSQRSLMSVWKAMFFDAGAYETDESRSVEWNRGAYIVEALAHCSACHSPRNLLGAEKPNMAMTGGVYMDEVPTGAVRPWSAPNLTAAPNGLGLWPAEEVAAYLTTGINSYVETFGPMNEVIINSTRHLTYVDVDAMSVYLKSLPSNGSGTRPKASDSVLGMGRTLYNLHCGTCHLPTGLGDEESAPQLAGGSLIVQSSNPASLINVILDGPELPNPPLPTKRYKPMEDFRYQLDDSEIAALASYLRASWGNTGGEVTAKQVAEQR